MDAEVISTSTPVAYAPPWASTLAWNTRVMMNAIDGEDQYERPHGPRPLGRHAVAGQVARHEVQQAGHRRGAGEPEDQDGAEVVDRAEDVAQVLVREIGEGAAVRRAARPGTPSAG